MRSKRLLTMLLVLCMILSVVSPAAVAVQTGDDSYVAENSTETVTNDKTDSSAANSLLVSDQSVSNTLRDQDGYGVAVENNHNGQWNAEASDVEPSVSLLDEDLSETLQELKEAEALYNKEDKVVAFVVMEDAPLADRYTSVAMVGTADEAKLLSVQNTVIEKIEKTVLGGAGLNVRYQFTYLTNAISIETEFANLSQIAQLPGVKSVYLMPVYNPCTVEEGTVSPNTASSGAMTGVTTAWELDYTGEGMKIAVIDTGLDLDHPSFGPLDEEMVSGNDSYLSAQEIDAVLTELNAYDKNRNITADKLYRSTKVPYAFNYVDANLTADHSSDQQGDHGTHVSGIAAANKLDTTTVVGMAPDAQIIVMKVFGASGGAYMDDIVAALEDAMTLGCDVVNASLGSAAGFSSSNSEQDLIYERLASQNIITTFSAGNDGTSSYNNMWGTDLNRTQNPDNAAVGSPSTYANNMSIASAGNAIVMTNYFSLADGTQVFYMDPYQYVYAMTDMVGWGYGELEYVIIDGVGAVDDFYDAEGNSLVSGKVAVIKRGETSFASKILNAEAAGAVAAIIWDNVSEDIFNFGMQISEDGATYPNIPACLIGLEDGQKLADASDKKLTVSAEVGERVAEGGQMSSFSSWGVSPDLRLLPDITGIGGNVYSCYDGGIYGIMSGTSMSAPQVAGVSALVMQYLYTRYPNSPDGTIRQLGEALLMSTADPIISTESGIAVSPRQQGAGLVNAAEAVTSEGYLTVNGDRPKVELGDNANGVYKFSFEIHNISDEAQTYALSSILMTEDVVTDGTNYYMAGYDCKLSGTVAFDRDTVTVAAGGRANVTVTITLSEEDKAMFAEYWANGGYVEGYVYLTNENGVDLNLPFLGFYGDWTDAPVFDTAYWYGNSFWGAGDGTVEGDEYFHVFWTNLMGTDWVLGFNPYSGSVVDENNNIIYDPAHNVVSPNGDGALDGIDEIYLSLLRNAKTLTFTYTVDGEVVHQEVITNASKTMYNSAYGQIIPWLYSWYGDDMYDFAGLESGTEVLLTIDANVDYGNGGDNTIQIPITVDTTKPELVNVYEVEQDGTYYLVAEVSDNVALASVVLMNPSGTRIYAQEYDFTVYPTEDGTYLVYFDVTDLGTKLMVAVCDYAANEAYYDVTYTAAGDNLPEMDTSALYAYRVYDGNVLSDHMYGWVSLETDATDDYANISVWTDDYLEYAAINAAEYAGGKIFAVDAVYNLVVMDPGLFDRTTICNLGVNVIDMTFDDSTDTMYVLSKQGYYVYLYELDVMTGEMTQLKSYGYYMYSPWAITDDDNGTLYAIKYNTSNIFTLDVAGKTYAMTAVTDADGASVTIKDSTGTAVKPSAYSQSIAWVDGTIYWAYYRESDMGNTTELIAINTTDWTSVAQPYAAKAYDADYNLVDYYPETELVGLLTLTETDWEIPAAAELTDLVLSEESLLMKVGDSATVTAIPLPWNYEIQSATWTTSDAAVATVTKGVITGVGEGTATVTIKADGIEKTIEVTVVDVKGTFNAYNYYSFDGYNGNMIQVDMQTMDYSLTASAPVDFMSGDYNGHDGCFYGYTENGQLYRWNMQTNDVDTIGSAADFYATDMAYDYSTGLMYALFTNPSSYESKICVVNMNTGAVMTVCDWTNDYYMYGLFTLACDSNGHLYALDNSGNLYSIDTEYYMPGSAMNESLGSLAYVQSMCWDYENDVLIWAHCDGTSINWIDVEKGFMLQLGDPTESGLFEFVGLYTVPETIEPLPEVAVESVDATEEMLLLVGGTKVADVTVYPFNATNQELVLTSADETVATVSGDSITGVGEGETTVSYKLVDGENTFEGTINVTVLQGADNIYGHILADLTYGSLQTWAKIPAEDTQHPDYLVYSDYTLFAEEYVDGKLYAYGYDPNDWTGNWQYFVMDAASFEILEQTDLGEGFPYVYDMTYDYTTGTMYCVAGASESEMNLYAANIKTGAITLLMQTEQNFMSIAAARDGMLYAIENSQYAVTGYDDWGWEIYGYTNAKLYAINAKTLEITYVGDTGMQCDMIASMAYDFDTDVMYWTPLSYNGNGVNGLAIVDLETAAATNLGTIGASGSQVSGLYIIADEYPEADASKLYNVLLSPSKTSLNVGESHTLSLSTIPMNLDGAQIVWTTSNPNVATVDANGTVTALAQGKATITVSVTFNGETLTATSTVAVLEDTASFLSWNRTDMGWSAISRADYSVTNLTAGEEVGVSAIAAVGTDIYGYDLNNGFFQLNTTTYERTYIATELNITVGEGFDEGYEYVFSVRDMAYDSANERMLVLGATMWYDAESDSYDELHSGCSIYSVDLETGDLTKLYTLDGYVYVYSLAVGADGTAYIYTTYDDGIYKVNVDEGSSIKLVTLQTQSLYGEYGYEIRQALHYDELTDTLYMTFTSNGKYYRMVTVDPVTGAISAYNNEGDQMYIGEVTYANWAYNGDLFSGLTFAYEHVHNYVAEVTEATCTEDGYITYTCSECDDSYIEVIPAAGHNYETVVTEATCTEDGYTTHTCTVCGDSYVTDVVPATGHSYSEWTVTVEADCFHDGELSRTCANCGDVETEVIPANSDHCPSKAFCDVDTAKWYHEALDFVLHNGLMNGISDTEFAPNANMTRAQLVTVLYRMAGSPKVTEKAPFTDVKEGSFYEKAVAWAYANGIVRGVTEDAFDPYGEVTREQMVTFFARYAAVNGVDISADCDLSGYDDGASVSSYAKEAMSWAISIGLIKGMEDGTITPKDPATRAQVATVLMRYCELYN